MIFLLLVACVSFSLAVPLAEPEFLTLQEYHENTSEFDNHRIIGGIPATAGQFPWVVGIFYYTDTGRYFCGGSLISSRWVLTAAHCAIDSFNFTVYIGGITVNTTETGRLTVYLTEKIVHDGYSSTTLNNDIALLRLPYPVNATSRINTVRLPSRADITGPNVPVTFSGWGKTSDSVAGISNTLNHVNLTTITNTLCAAIYGSSVVISSTLCAVGNPYESTCSGDSGGPLVDYDVEGNAIQVGVASFVHRSGCASGNPSGYVRISSFLDWIHDIGIST